MAKYIRGRLDYLPRIHCLCMTDCSVATCLFNYNLVSVDDIDTALCYSFNLATLQVVDSVLLLNNNVLDSCFYSNLFDTECRSEVGVVVWFIWMGVMVFFNLPPPTNL